MTVRYIQQITEAALVNPLDKKEAQYDYTRKRIKAVIEYHATTGDSCCFVRELHKGEITIEHINSFVMQGFMVELLTGSLNVAYIDWSK